MLVAMKYKDILLDCLYLDSNGDVRRKQDGYLGRFKKDDLAVPHKDPNGYLKLQVPSGIRRSVMFHHIVFILSGNIIPDGMELDHIDGNRENNRLSNLRLVDRSINNRNRKKRSDNTSGVTGIRWSGYHQHYVIRRTVGKKRISRSRKTMEEALLVLDELTNMDSQYTSRHGK